MAALATAVVWKLSQLTKDPRSAPLRSVTACLLCAGVSYPLAMPGGASGFDAVAGHGAAKLTQNVLLLATCYFLMCFYLYSAADSRAGRIRARWEGVGLLLVISAISAAALAAPHTVLAGSFSTADMTIRPVAVFYLVAGLYLMYSLAAAFYWTLLYARKSQRPLSTGLWLVAVGLAGMVAACAIRAAFVVIRSQGGSIPTRLGVATSLALVVSIPLFVAGVSYPSVRNRLTVLRVWRQHRQFYRRLYPLWLLLSEAFPYTVLHTTGSPSWRNRWGRHSIHHRYHRRVIECRDGLVEINPYLARLERDGTGLDSTPPERVARILHRIADAHDRSATGPERAVLLVSPRQRGRDIDVQQLLALSDALRSTI
ncbi:MAB_1171c family putative transporter [Streptomyces sp. NPDC059982]|uniref:MAB_1171c family putative transporter n=1 Tax=unclassified Streptomyces TaxID=2593676 RepID=UPI00343E0858